jgi:hypothetical protein
MTNCHGARTPSIQLALKALHGSHSILRSTQGSLYTLSEHQRIPRSTRARSTRRAAPMPRHYYLQRLASADRSPQLSRYSRQQLGRGTYQRQTRTHTHTRASKLELDPYLYGGHERKDILTRHRHTHTPSHGLFANTSDGWKRIRTAGRFLFEMWVNVEITKVC